jgi:hypothetical protein
VQLSDAELITLAACAVIPRLIQRVIHPADEFLHLRARQAGGTIVAQRFSGVENSLVGTLKFFHGAVAF